MSTLAYLSQFPIDILKIDRSFVQGITSRHQDLEPVEAIIVLARSLCLGTLAPNDFETLLGDSVMATESGLEAGEPPAS